MNDSKANNPDSNVIFSGTKEVAENLKFNESGLQEWFRENISSAGKILKIAQFKGGQSNPTYKITTKTPICSAQKTTRDLITICSCSR